MTYIIYLTESDIRSKSNMKVQKRCTETLLSIVFVLLYSILSDHGATQPSHIYLAKACHLLAVA